MKASRAVELFEEIREKYSQPEELEEWSTIVDSGLTSYEESYIKKFIPRKDLLLDIGCGGGREGIALTKLGYQVVGFDFVYHMVMNAKKTAIKQQHNIKFLVMNALNLGFSDKTFKSALMTGQVLSFIPFRKNRIRALRETFRVLKPGGILILTTHSRRSHVKYKLYFLVMDNLRKILRFFGFNTLEIGDRFATKISNADSKGKQYLHMYSMEETFEDLSLAGFQILRCQSRKEILEGKENSIERERDYYLIYAAIKKKDDT